MKRASGGGVSKNMELLNWEGGTRKSSELGYQKYFFALIIGRIDHVFVHFAMCDISRISELRV